MDTSQVLKGVLDTAVLGALRGGRTYGYDLVRRLRECGFSEIAEASVYGTLRRLHGGGLLSTEIVESGSGPPRKYYSLTGAGSEYLESSIITWKEITSTMDHLINEEHRP